MKKVALSTLAVMLGLWGLSTTNLQAAHANTNAMLVTFQITGAIQQTSVVTNGNLVTTTKTTTPLKIGNQNILNLLQVEFATNFPTGAQLAYNLSGDLGFRVLDQNGNSILDASTNAADASYVFTLSNNVAGAVSPIIITGKIVDNTVTTNQTENLSEVITDYGVFYHDSHGNNFHMDGLLTLKANLNLVSGTATYTTASFTIVGSGGGTIFNPATGTNATGVFTKAKLSAKGSGIIQ